MGVRGTVVLLAALALGGCGGAAAHQNTTTAPTTPTTEPPTTTTTPPAPPPPTQSTPTPKPSPPTARRRQVPLPPASGSDTVETVTDDGEVLVLNNGDVYSASEDASSWENEPVHVSEDETKITKDDNGDQLDVSKVGDTSTGESYSGSGDELDTKSSDGAILVLKDESVWAVDNADQGKVAAWNAPSTIHVGEETGGSGSYVLINEDEHESVTATYIGDK